MSEYPKSMVHPHYQRGTSKPISVMSTATGRTITDYQGTPDRFPPVTVNNEMQEEQHRAKGYRAINEKGPPVMPYQEYPLMMRHPDHADAVPDQQDARKIDGKFEVFVIHGSPEKYPDVAVNNKDEEKKWIEKGYQRSGTTDPDAVQAAIAAPYDPSRTIEEYPKMVDGVIVDPKASEGSFKKYPMWIGDGENGTTVNNEAEEIAARKKYGKAKKEETKDTPTVAPKKSKNQKQSARMKEVWATRKAEKSKQDNQAA